MAYNKASCLLRSEIFWDYCILRKNAIDAVCLFCQLNNSLLYIKPKL